MNKNTTSKKVKKKSFDSKSSGSKNFAKASVNIDKSKRVEKAALFLVVLLSLIVYLPSLQNDFILNWDDGGYIHEHKLIHKLTWDNFVTIFNPSTFYKGNYHPLTTFFYALQYSMVGESAFLYHLTNLIFHLLNVALVFILIRKIDSNYIVASFTALLFGIHPMHVESVAWISELKDVLYTFFYLLAAIVYINYVRNREFKLKIFFLSFLLFFLSLLSKSAAVAFPVLLIIIDVYLGRKLSVRLVLEKLPFFILSMAFGLIAVLSQGEKGAIQDLTPMYGLFERILIVCHSTMTYFWKLLLPINLAAMYPYPATQNGLFPIIYYLAPLIVVAILIMPLFFKINRKKYLFGIFFFFVNIALVLQIIPVGGAALAERYTYVPYIGLFFIVGNWMNTGLEMKSVHLKTIRIIIYMTGFLFVVFFSVLTWQRILKWKNGEVLMRDLTRVYPYLPFSYNNLGYYYHRWEKNQNKAIYEYSKALQMDSTYYQAWSNRGVVYNNIGKHQEAIFDFTKSLKFKKDNLDALIGRANSLSALERFEEALPDYDYYLSLKPDDAQAWVWRGIAHTKLENYDQALKDFKQSEKLNNQNYESYYWTGLVYFQKKDYPEALKFLNRAIELNKTKSDIFSWRGLVKYYLNDTDASITDFNAAISMNPSDAAAYVNRSLAYEKKGNFKQAWYDINAAGNMGYPLDRDYFFKLEAKVLQIGL